MKRSSADTGLPESPPQVQIRAIPLANLPPGPPPPPPPSAPPRPTMATVIRPSVPVWPQLAPASFTVPSSPAYPIVAINPPVTPSTAAPGMRLATRPSAGDLPRTTAPSGSTGRYTPGQIAGKTELTIKLATRADLIDLADTLRHPHTVNKIALITNCPQELRGTLEAICSSVSPLHLAVSYGGPRLATSSLNQLFSGLKARQAPLKSLRWTNTAPSETSQEIDQRTFESLFALQLLERVHFSGPQAGQLPSVIVSNAEQLALSLEKNGSLRSISFQRINGAAFISAILQGAASSQTLENMHLGYLDLTPIGESLLAAVNGNRKLQSVSVRGCQLASGAMTQVLRSIQQHPALQALDFSAAQIPHDELQFIGEPIGELLVTNDRINTLLCRYTTSPVNIKALTLGLDANTNLSSFAVEALGSPSSSAADLSESNNRSDIDHMFKSNKGLRQILIRIPSSEGYADYSILRGLAENTSIKSLTIENLSRLDEVIDLMTHHPQFKQLTLKTGQMSDDKKYWFSESVRLLADVLNDNKNLLNFSLIFHSGHFHSTLNKAILRIDEVTTRNRIRNMAPLAGAVMSRRQNLLSHAPGALPTLPAEVNQLLFEATIDYLSPKNAKAIYDTVLPFTPLPGNQ